MFVRVWSVLLPLLLCWCAHSAELLCLQLCLQAWAEVTAADGPMWVPIAAMRACLTCSTSSGTVCHPPGTAAPHCCPQREPCWIDRRRFEALTQQMTGWAKWIGGGPAARAGTAWHADVGLLVSSVGARWLRESGVISVSAADQQHYSSSSPAGSTCPGCQSMCSWPCIARSSSVE